MLAFWLAILLIAAVAVLDGWFGANGLVGMMNYIGVAGLGWLAHEALTAAQNRS